MNSASFEVDSLVERIKKVQDEIVTIKNELEEFTGMNIADVIDNRSVER